MRPLTGAQYRHVQGLERGLAVLKALNYAADGKASVRELSECTTLHRTTVRRLLETLLTLGYVRRSASDDSYRLTLCVRDLSDGFTDDEWVAAVAAPVLGRLLKAVLWPSDLTTLDGTEMVIRETTHRFSALSFHRAMVGRRLPLLYTASGRAYLAFCPEKERKELVRHLIAGGGLQAALARDSALLARLLNRVRQCGYATSEGDWGREAHIGAIAVPIERSKKVLGCLNVVYLKKAMSTEKAAQSYLAALRQAKQEIENAVGMLDVKTS